MTKRMGIIFFIVLLLDQLSKFMINKFMDLNQSIVLIKNFFKLTNVRNFGVAFSMLNDQRFLIILISLIFAVILYFYMKSIKTGLLKDLAFGLIYGGLLGNLLDRLILGYVRDFLDFILIKYDYPVFNIADSAIVIGVILLIIILFKKDGSKDGV